MAATAGALKTERDSCEKVQGIAAALLPFEPDGQVAADAFQKHLLATHRAGLMNAVNMDTGYVNYLGDEEKKQVLQWTREALGAGIPFVAGAYIEGRAGDVISLYRREIDQIVGWGGTPIIFQTSRLHRVPVREKVAAYREICKGFPAVIGFELGSMFAPNGEIFDEDTVRGLMDIPEMKGMKHSSLDRLQELRRLDLRDAHRPGFRIYTGNVDSAIARVTYTSGDAHFTREVFRPRRRRCFSVLTFK